MRLQHPHVTRTHPRICSLHLTTHLRTCTTGSSLTASHGGNTVIAVAVGSLLAVMLTILVVLGVAHLRSHAQAHDDSTDSDTGSEVSSSLPPSVMLGASEDTSCDLLWENEPIVTHSHQQGEASPSAVASSRLQKRNTSSGRATRQAARLKNMASLGGAAEA